MKLKRIASGLLATLVLCFGLTGCIGNFVTDALEIEGEDVPAGVYMLMQVLAVNEVGEKLEDTTTPLEELLAMNMDDVVGESTVGDLLEIDPESELAGGTIKDWVQWRAVQLCARMIAVERLSAERGLELTEEEQAEIEENIQNVKGTDSESFYSLNGIGEPTLRRYWTTLYLDDTLFNSYYNEDGEKAPTREEISDHYATMYAHIRMAFVYTYAIEDSEEDMDYAVKEMDRIADVISGSASIDDEATHEQILAMEQEIETRGEAWQQKLLEEAAAEAANNADEAEPEGEDAANEDAETEEDTVDADADAETEGEDAAEETEEEEEEEPTVQVSDYYVDYEATGDSQVFEEDVVAEIKGKAVGEGGVIAYADGMYIIYEVVEPFTDDESYESARDGIVSGMKADEYDDFIDEVAEAYAVSWKPLAKWYYRPEKMQG